MSQKFVHDPIGYIRGGQVPDEVTFPQLRAGREKGVIYVEAPETAEQFLAVIAREKGPGGLLHKAPPTPVAATDVETAKEKPVYDGDASLDLWS